MHYIPSRYFSAIALLAIAAASCSDSSPVQPSPPACSYSLSASSLSFGAPGGTSAVSVTTAASCTWTASSDRGWMTIAGGASGTGSGTVNVGLTANANPTERTGTLTIAGQAVAVRQDGAVACSIQIAPASAAYGKDAASGTFGVTAGEQCPWSAASNAAWLAITSGSSGTGNGTVAYALERNRELNSRSAVIAVGERTFTVTQAADTGPAPICDYSVAPVEFTPCMTSPTTLSATIAAPQGCVWTAEADAPWITVTSGQSGAGSGVISFRVGDNWDAPRRSVVKVRWPTATAGQNLQVLQAGCSYAVSTSTVSMAAAGGPARFDVIQQSDPYTCGGPTQNACMWTAIADVPWIAVTTAMPQFGDNPVSFSVAANDTTAARTGRITVRDKVVVITQAGR